MRRIFRFGIIGSSGFLIDVFFTFLLKEIVGFNAYVANAIGFILATSSNYYFNKRWTFEEKVPINFTQFFLFFVISSVGLILNTAIIYFLSETFHVTDPVIASTYLVSSYNAALAELAVLIESGDMPLTQVHIQNAFKTLIQSTLGIVKPGSMFSTGTPCLNIPTSTAIYC